MKICLIFAGHLQMTKISLIFLLVVFLVPSYAQTPVSIKGQVRFPEGGGYYVVVVSPAYAVLTSKYYETEDFRTEEVCAEKFIVQIYSPYAVGTKNFPLSNERRATVIDIGFVELGGEVILQDVTVRTRRPTFKVTEGKMVHDIEHNSEYQSLGSVVDILKNLPLIRVENDLIGVFGKKNTLILVNGQPSKDNNWEFIQPENIKSVEILTNPPAQYSAGGDAVINIVTRHTPAGGLNGHVFASAAKGEYWRSNNRFQLGYANQRLNFYTNIGCHRDRRLFVENYERYFDDGAEMQNELRQKRTTYPAYHLLLGGDYRIGDRHTIGIQYQRIQQKSERFTDNRSDLRLSSAHLSRFLTQTSVGQEVGRNIYDLNYVFAIDSLGKKLSVGMGYVDYNSRENSDISEITDDSYYKAKKSDSKANIGLLTSNIDYEHRTSNGYVWRIGAYLSRLKNDSHYSLYHIAAEMEKDPDFSNGIIFKENKYAAYLGVRKNWNRFSLLVGARYEHAGYKSTERSKVYKDFFPSVEIEYAVSEKLQASLSYSRKISRPAFRDLDPSTIYIDTLTYYVGNTDLRPEYSHNIILNAVYNRYFILSLGYSKVRDPLYMAIRKWQPDTKICIATTENLKSEEIWTLSLSAPYQYKGWITHNSIGLTHNRVRFYIDGVFHQPRKMMFYAYSSHNFKLPAGISLFFTYQYNSQGQSGIFSFNSRYILNAGTSMSFWNDKLLLSVRYDDILHQDKMRNRADLDNVDFTYRSRYDSSSLFFSVRYKFGQSSKSYKIKNNTAEEQKRIK